MHTAVVRADPAQVLRLGAKEVEDLNRESSGLDRRPADRYGTFRDAAGSSVLMRRSPR